MTPTFTRILVPTDFSPRADAAVDAARTLAERFGASLHLLHVLEDPSGPGGFGSEICTPEPAGLRVKLLTDAKRRLATRLRQRDRMQCGATLNAVFGTPANVICDYAIWDRIDLIVMATHGRTGLAHLVMGSVAEKVLRTAPCPVLIIRPAAKVQSVVAAEVETAAVCA